MEELAVNLLHTLQFHSQYHSTSIRHTVSLALLNELQTPFKPKMLGFFLFIFEIMNCRIQGIHSEKFSLPIAVHVIEQFESLRLYMFPIKHL
jgi:hypothetical protein